MEHRSDTARPSTPPSLRRELGVGGAVMLGLGSILGTGVFVSIGVAAGVAGPAVILAIALAAVVATANALSSAQLAASHPVSGGTYEYGYRYLSPWAGFAAGWMFLAAKSASAATAALGFSAYLLEMLGLAGEERAWRIGVALAVTAVLTAIVLGGIRRSSRVNMVIVCITILALLAFVAGVAPAAWRDGAANLRDQSQTSAQTRFWPALLEAAALMFVAFTGYGRVATLGEEVRDPKRTIPRAIVVTLWATAALYILVSIAAVAAAGAGRLGHLTRMQAAPLEAVARLADAPAVAVIVSIGAMTAMLGVLLNLILGLSRVLLAMGRRGDMPAATGRVSESGTPGVAVIVVGAVIAALVLIGDVKTTWSFSAFTVLIYYAITNLSALRLPAEQRIWGRWWAWMGLVGCLGLAFWVQWQIWGIGLTILALGLVWKLTRRASAG